MSNLAKVWNDNDHPHTEKYKGNMIEIPPHKYIEMDRDEALQFQGQFTMPKKLGSGVPDPRYFKMIRVEGGEDIAASYNQLTNPVTGQICKNQEELDAQLKQYRHLHVADEKASGEIEKLRQELQEAKQAINELRGSIDAGSSKTKR